MSDVQKTIRERQKTHGNYMEQSGISCGLKSVMSVSRHWKRLRPDQREALEMIAVKISRILSGDPDHADSWHDIAGYSTLVENRLKGE